MASAVDLRSRVCHHLDGLAVGSTVEALSRRGFFELLLAQRGPIGVDELVRELAARRGYFHVAVKLLAAQGFVARAGNVAAGDVTVALTDSGRLWLDYQGAYRQVPELLGAALATAAGADPPDPRRFERLGIGDTAAELATRVRLHVEGHLVAPSMAVLAEVGMRGGADALSGVVRRHAAVLRTQGWATPDGALTAAGEAALRAAPQYFYPVSYLPTTAAVDELLFGAPPQAEPGEPERHVDRALDVAFSGVVYERQCREPFLEIALPLFDREFGEQPAAVVDTGAGDGTLLIDLYRAVVARTRRGRHLASRPLMVVAAELNETARRIGAERLEAAGVPHLAITGDIGAPERLAAELAAAGLDPQVVLHVSKSVVHNRRYRPPTRDVGLQPATRAVFVDEDGGLIAARDLEQNLVEHFESWRPWTRRHGMIVIEAHTVAPEIAARTVGANVITGLDASHGYSRQYLVEAEVHRRATRRAGYVAAESVDLMAQFTGRPLMTIEHLIDEDNVPWLSRVAGV